MYLSFFNLREAPFNLTPDPRFLFLSPQHEEALSHLLYGIYERKGFIEITGEVGMGKTILCRALLDRLDASVSTALIFNSYLNRMELLQAITSDFGLEPPLNTTCKGYVDVLNTYLLAEFTAGCNAVVIIDEAQNLEPTVLEQLRMLSNLETERGKLIQVVLVGQPELRDKLSTPHMRQLNQRIAVRFHIHELTRTETAQYITHRMSVAGAANTVTFTRRALRLIHTDSGGLPRRINLLCDRALITAFVKETHRVTVSTVQRSIRDLEGVISAPQLRGRRRLKRLSLGILASTGAVGLLGSLLLVPGLQRHVLPQGTAPVLTFLEPVSPPPPVPVPQPKTLPSPEALPTASPDIPPVTPATQAWSLSEGELAYARTLWQIKAQTQSFLAALPVTQGTSWETALSDSARVAGLDVMPLRLSIWQLQKVSRPCFIEVFPEPEAPPALWVLARGQEDGILIYQEPTGLQMIPLQQLRQIWYGKLYLASEVGQFRGTVLRQGMRGERIRALQAALKASGYLTVSPSGQFDLETQQAVKRFQRDNQLVVDGYAGRQTLMMLLHFGAAHAEHTT